MQMMEPFLTHQRHKHMKNQNSIIYKEPKFLKNYQNQILESKIKKFKNFKKFQNEYDQMHNLPCNNFNVSSNGISTNQSNSPIQIKCNQWQGKSSCFSSPWPRQQIQNWPFVPLRRDQKMFQMNHKFSKMDHKFSWVSSHLLERFYLPIFVLFLVSCNKAALKFDLSLVHSKTLIFSLSPFQQLRPYLSRAWQE